MSMEGVAWDLQAIVSSFPTNNYTNFAPTTTGDVVTSTTTTTTTTTTDIAATNTAAATVAFTEDDFDYYFRTINEDSFLSDNTTIHDDELLLDQFFDDLMFSSSRPLPSDLFETQPLTTSYGKEKKEEEEEKEEGFFKPGLLINFQPMLSPNDIKPLPVSHLFQFGESSSSRAQLQQEPQFQFAAPTFTLTTTTSTTNSALTSTRSKRRKIQQKRVVFKVPVDQGGLISDKWAWRKYGQKPVKGSPHPRAYYKCSSSKDCIAKKLVEKSYSDPSMLVITYKAEHNHPIPTHRNSLAGSSRHGSNRLNNLSSVTSTLQPSTPFFMSTTQFLMEDNNNNNNNIKQGSLWREDNSHLVMRNTNDFFMGLEVLRLDPLAPILLI